MFCHPLPCCSVLILCYFYGFYSFITYFIFSEQFRDDAHTIFLQELSKRDFPDGVNLHTKDIPVEYLYVEEEIPNLEKELNPDVCPFHLC